MKKLLFVVFSLLFIPSFAQKKKVAKPVDPLVGIEKELNQILKDQKVAGFAVAVVKKDSVIYAQGFGYKDYENKVPVTPNTLFAIGSSSKAFTASLLGLMQKEGKLEYDKPIRTYLPDLKFYDAEMDKNITVRDAITHRSGLSRYDMSWYYFNTSNRDSLLQRVQYMKPTLPLRQAFQYNNFMYLAQGVIAEKHYGKPWEEVVKEKLLLPLGMKRSTAYFNDWINDSDVSFGYSVEKDSLIKREDYYNINGMGPAGSINSSVLDMTNWLKVWINKGKLAGKEILSEAYIREAISPQMVAGAGLPSSLNPDVQFANYGFGWFTSSYRGHFRVEHGGNIRGFTSNVAFFPTDSLGIVVLANQNGSALNTIVISTLADKLLGLSGIDWNARNLKAKANKPAETVGEENKKKNTKPSHKNEDYTGYYSNKAYGQFEVVNSNDSLFFISPFEKRWMRHYHYDVFELVGIDKTGKVDTNDILGVKAPFYMNEAGDIVSINLSLEFGMDPFVFAKSAKPKSVKKEDLEIYVGEYQLGSVKGIKVSNRDTTLFFFFPGQKDYELVPLGNHKFNVKDLAGFSLEFILEEGKIISVKMNQPQGTVKAQKVK
jgi:CubicO group peptidase (beta-lactamase class C family)